jgi:hypothetical protein
MVLITVIGAFVHFAIGFATTWNSPDTRATADADFWYNISSSVLAIVANLDLVVPLMPLIKRSSLTMAYVTMWARPVLGITFAVVSAAIYPGHNTA